MMFSHERPRALLVVLVAVVLAVGLGSFAFAAAGGMAGMGETAGNVGGAPDAAGAATPAAAVPAGASLSAPGPLAQAAKAAREPGQSEGGSAVGILVMPNPAQGGDPDAPDVGDSYLGILLTPSPGQLATVTYRLTEDVVFTEDKVAPGGLAVKPTTDPAWPAGQAWPEGFVGEPAFVAWCTKDDAGVLVPYDFSTPVMADLVLWASWADSAQGTVTVTLDAGEGGLVTHPDDPTLPPAQTVSLSLQVGALYPALPTPERTGWQFVGWFDAAEGGTQVWPTPEEAAPARVPGSDATLWAHWAPKTYWVHYVIDQDRNDAHDQSVPYDQNAGAAFLGWDELASDGHGHTAPQNKKLLGWHTDPAGDDTKGTFYVAGAALPDLAQAAPGGSLNVWAQWQGEHAADEFAVEFRPEGGTFADGSTDAKRYDAVKLGEYIEAFDDPKRTGYQFEGWWLRANGEPDGAFVRAWDFDEAVHEDLVLFARWNLRLDVTVPVSVGFAVNAGTGEAVGPEADRYAVKSRTVVPVQVEAFEVTSEQAELAAFFETAEGESWDAGVGETVLSLRSERAAAPMGLSLAGDARQVAASEKAAYALAAFDYGVLADDAGWQGADPSERLPIAFGLSISDKLNVKLGQPGAVPIAHVAVTVSAGK